MKIFGMGGFELVIILVVILLIFGPKNLPKLGKAFGKTVSNLRDGMNEGKKKEVDEASAEGAVAETEADVAEKPAEIAGQIEAATPAAEKVETAAEKVEAEVVVEEAPATAEPFDAEAAVDEVFEPKKVRRVVKKKVASE